MVADKIHCLDFSTEVLTLDGWKTVHQLTKNDYIATLKDEKLVYEKPINIMIYNDYEGSMYYIKNSSIDFVVTGNHRMWVSKNDIEIYNFERADEIIGKYRKYKKNAIWDKADYQFTLSGEPRNIEMKDWLTFFGIWYSEGCVSGTKGTVTISVNKQIVKDNLFSILEKFVNYKYNKEHEEVHIYDYQLYKYMEPLSVGAENKKLPKWVFELSCEQTKYLISCMLLGDDSKNKKTDCEFYYTTSVELANQFQQLCLHAGWASTISITGDGRRISVTKIKLYPSVNHGHVSDQEEKYLENEKCPVFCLQVPSEVFYVRRNGKCAWTANSRAQGPVTTLCRQPLEGRSIRSKWYCKILLVYGIVGNIFKLREHLVMSLILTYFGNIIRILVNY